jgi:hypothetical protein
VRQLAFDLGRAGRRLGQADRELATPTPDSPRGRRGATIGGVEHCRSQPRPPRREPLGDRRRVRSASRPPRNCIHLLLPFLLLLLVSCGQGPSRRTSADAPSASSNAQPLDGAATPTPTPSPTATPTPTVTGTASPSARLSVRIELEPNDYPHRNYCAEGAIGVLLSTWTSTVPSIDAIGVAAHVVESYGTIGANAVQAINAYLEQITGTAGYAYSGTHVTSLPLFESQLETDLSGRGRLTSAGHGSPVLVHVMTATLPGWDGYQAQHMIAVFGYDLAPGMPDTDTVTYAESAGTVAGYRGPHTETISLAALWTAMQNYNQDITTDPVTVIS